MDILTIIVFAGFVAALLALIVEIAVKRPDAFFDMMEGARPFAEKALAESAAMSAGSGNCTEQTSPTDEARRAPQTHAA